MQREIPTVRLCFHSITINVNIGTIIFPPSQFATTVVVNWIISIFIFLLLIKLYFVPEDQPKITLLFGLHAGIVMFFHWIGCCKKNEVVSLATTQFLGTILSLICFTTGVPWYFENYFFIEVVSSIFGLESIKKESLTVGSIMLFSMGYVVFYGVFQIGKVLDMEEV